MSQLIDNYQRKTWKAGDKLLASDVTLMSETLDCTENAVVDIQTTTIPTIQADYKEADQKIVDDVNATIGELPEGSTVVSYVDKQVADLVGTAPETLDTLKEVADAILVNKDAISAIESVVTTNRESIDANTSKLATVSDKLDDLSSKAATYKQFEYQDGDETISRKTIQLNNFDTISGITTTGLGVNIATVNKFDVADFGSAQVHMNLNSKSGEVTINDTLRVATDADLDTKVSKSTFNDTVATLAVAKDVSDHFEQVEKSISDNVDTLNQTITTSVEDLTSKFEQADTDLHSTITSEVDTKIASVADVANAAAVKSDVDQRFDVVNASLTTKADVADVDQLTAKFDDYYTADQVDSKLVTVYKASGNVDTFDDLAKLEDVVNGNVYNVVDSGKNYVAIIDDQGSISFDDLGGIVDLSAYSTSEEIGDIYKTIESAKSDFDTLDQNKVDKIEGKQLSTEDFTSELKSKLEGVEQQANNYVLPQATSDVLGGVKVGTGLDVEDGVVSVSSQFVVDQTSQHFEQVEKSVSDLDSKVDQQSEKTESDLSAVKSELIDKIDTKADVTALNDYVLTADLTEQLTPYAFESEVTEKLASKLDASKIDDYALKADVFTKEEVKTALEKKLNAEDANTKFDEINTSLVAKADTSDVETKLAAKLDASEIANYSTTEQVNAALDSKLDVETADSKFEEVSESITESRSDVLNEVQHSYSTKTQVTDAVADIPVLLAQISQLQDRIKALETPSVEQIEIDDSNYTVSQPEKDLEVVAALIADSKSSITAKSIDATGVTMENANVSMTATGNITINDINTSGELAKSVSNAGMSLNTDGYVKIDGATWNQSGYNAIEIGLQKAPKSVDIDNVHVTGTLSNNAINIFDWQPNAVINIRNCSFAQVSNMLRISNKSCNSATFNIINCTVDKWETNPEYSGLILFQDYTSASAEQAKADNQFGKIKINLINVVGPDGRMVGDTATFKENHWFYTYFNNAKDLEVTDDMLPTIEGK